jgi:hypothetical protein
MQEYTTLFSIIEELIEAGEAHRDEDGRPTLAHKKPRILVIADDIATDISRHSALSRFSQRYRHLNASLYFTCQTYRSLPNTIRGNSSFWILFGTENQAEINRLEEEHNGIPNFRKMYLEATSEPYSFLTIDVPGQKVRTRFKPLPMWESKR